MTFYKQLSDYIEKGFGMLDHESASQVKLFISSLQNSDGGFSDRAGNSDLYYSLFAHFILKGAKDSSYQKQLKCFISEKRKKKNKHLVDLCSLAILNKDLTGNRVKGMKYLFSAIKYLPGKSDDGSLAYSYFLLLLTLDAYGFNNKATRWFVKRFYRNNSGSQGLPCPALAAQIVFKNQLGYDVQHDCNLLASYFEVNRGFKVSPVAGTSDLLSTAVALFALTTSGFDISLLAPTCLRFVDENYRDGAFLSGDSDESRDSEYTFYGLLSLGSMK